MSPLKIRCLPRQNYLKQRAREKENAPLLTLYYQYYRPQLRIYVYQYLNIIIFSLFVFRGERYTFVRGSSEA